MSSTRVVRVWLGRMGTTAAVASGRGWSVFKPRTDLRTLEHGRVGVAMCISCVVSRLPSVAQRQAHVRLEEDALCTSLSLTAFESSLGKSKSYIQASVCCRPKYIKLVLKTQIYLKE